MTNHSLNPPVPNLTSDETDRGQTERKDAPELVISSEKECVVCMDNERNCVLHPCHHLCTCINCGRLLFKRQDACPICRRAITNVFRVYHP